MSEVLEVLEKHMYSSSTGIAELFRRESVGQNVSEGERGEHRNLFQLSAEPSGLTHPLFVDGLLSCCCF